jgi:N-methylhydantoinase B
MVYEHMAPGEVLINNSGGGGGWGNPFERDPQEVLEDVLNEYVSIKSAHEDYGVVIDPATMAIDAEATASVRRSR